MFLSVWNYFSGCDSDDLVERFVFAFTGVAVRYVTGRYCRITEWDAITNCLNSEQPVSSYRLDGEPILYCHDFLIVDSKVVSNIINRHLHGANHLHELNLHLNASVFTTIHTKMYLWSRFQNYSSFHINQFWTYF